MFTNVYVHQQKKYKVAACCICLQAKKISRPVRIISLTSVQVKQKLVGEVGVIIWRSAEKTEMVFGLTLSRVYKSRFEKSGFHLYPVNGRLFNADCHRCNSYGKAILSVICQCIIIMCHRSVRTNKTRKAFFVRISKTKIVLNARTF